MRADVLLASGGLMGITSVPRLRAATDQDARTIRELLERNGLPTGDLDSARPEFVVACEGPQLIGVGGLQRFGATALLRSVAIAADWRGAGIGRLLVHEIEQRAGKVGITELVLLTQTAKGFFEHQGYHVIERQNVPPAVQASEEFRSLCPSTATCMSKVLKKV